MAFPSPPESDQTPPHHPALSPLQHRSPAMDMHPCCSSSSRSISEHQTPPRCAEVAPQRPQPRPSHPLLPLTPIRSPPPPREATPGMCGLSWPPQLTTEPPNIPQSAQGSARISPALPTNGITSTQLSRMLQLPAASPVLVWDSAKKTPKSSRFEHPQNPWSHQSYLRHSPTGCEPGSAAGKAVVSPRRRWVQGHADEQQWGC